MGPLHNWGLCQGYIFFLGGGEGDGPPSPLWGWDWGGWQLGAPAGRGGRCPWARRCRLAFPLVIYYSPPSLFLLLPPPFPCFSLTQWEKPGSRGWLCPAAVHPPSLPLPHPSLFLKNVGSGLQPPALAASLLARRSPLPPPQPPSPPTASEAEPPAVPAALFFLVPPPSIPSLGVPGCGRGEHSLASGRNPHAGKEPAGVYFQLWAFFLPFYQGRSWGGEVVPQP